MIETKHIPQENTRVIYKLLELCKEKEPNVIFELSGGKILSNNHSHRDSSVYKSSNPEVIISEMDRGDEELGIKCMIGGDCIGYFGILPYEDSESMIFVFSDTEFCTQIYNKLIRSK